MPRPNYKVPLKEFKLIKTTCKERKEKGKLVNVALKR